MENKPVSCPVCGRTLNEIARERIVSEPNSFIVRGDCPHCRFKCIWIEETYEITEIKYLRGRIN